MTNTYTSSYQPDVLEVISNLSNDAVFTPPKVVNAVLDLLPQHVWSNPEDISVEGALILELFR